MKKVYDSPNNIAIFIGIGLLNQNNKNIRFEPITRYNQFQMLVYEMMIMSWKVRQALKQPWTYQNVLNNHERIKLYQNVMLLTHSVQMHPFSTPWKLLYPIVFF